ncbi:Piso0_002880 [Millerozyma farinosa CBS 7064]|uniref:Piso0_002880 protein n=1 Tax=Pichia sorbitophila (strain ATCC MYA-4447 / BCRC 22081 / CBS 7064 / NBRC 10061 / NRRL Y-12695) TaxID=559304 RepID=G8YDS0_PICSO|nr:Piso0_002880 [Millerozyma farinosa CBS 7064]
MDLSVINTIASTREAELKFQIPQTEEAKRGNEKQKEMGFKEAIRLHYKAVIWSLLLSVSCLMEAYDQKILFGFTGLPVYQKRFGEEVSPGKYSLSSKWTTLLTNGVHFGQIIGLFIAGIVVERIGYRYSIIGAMAVAAGIIFILFFAQNLHMLFAGGFIFGIPQGFFITLSTTYATDICPMALRPYLTTWNNMCWTIGALIVTGILAGFSNTTSEWGWRIPYAIQWAWIPIVTVICIFAPESPWWLVRMGKIEEARKSLARLSNEEDADEIEATISMIKETNEYEKKIQEGTTYMDCFRGSSWRRTEISCMCGALSPMCGFALTGYGTYFFEQAGLRASQAYYFGIGLSFLSLFMDVVNWFLMARIGRRPLILFGVAMNTMILFIIGCLGIHENKNTGWGLGGVSVAASVLCFSMITSLAVVPEVPSTRLRNKTTVISRNVYNVFSIYNNVLTTYMINATGWGWGPKAGFYWSGSSAIFLIWAFFRLAETKGRTPTELDFLFEKGVPARNFNSANIQLDDEINYTEVSVHEKEKS